MEAEEILNKILTMYGKDHPNTLSTRYSLTLCVIERGDLDEAARSLQEILEVRRKILGNNHLDTIETSERLNYVIRQKEHPYSTNSQVPDHSKPSIPPTSVSRGGLSLKRKSNSVLPESTIEPVALSFPTSEWPWPSSRRRVMKPRGNIGWQYID